MNSNSNKNTEAPFEVIQAIEQGRKIEAIKLLREHTGLGLKESKEWIDTYERQHPGSIAPMRKGDGNMGIPVIALLIFAWLLYRFLFS
ncbi:MAG: 50S ribosomal protein L7/L12 [Betaproteobacteria bacterium HGW-Betaproteobacteria-1]|jgi:hypothetical protein|nr:MAG: 50S ribosomal protein L7/L12 [Betaproteobacteria bacterium HGW-Betaproteobacteria-1]